MALVAGQRSTLNPNAPLFIPAVYRQVEDFSPEWWDLVTTSTWFRDYWLSEHPEGSFDGSADADPIEDLLPEKLDMGFDDEDEFGNLEAQFEELVMMTEEEEQKKKPENGAKMDMKGILKELSVTKNGKSVNVNVKPPSKASKYPMKAGCNLSPKSAAPRRIHQIHQPR